MFLRSGTLLAIAAALLMSTTVASTDAGERMNGHQRIVKRLHVRHSPQIVIRRVVVNIDRDRHHRRLHRPVNTYSGDVAVYHRRNVGTWSYGSLAAPLDAGVSEPTVRIIDIDKLAGRNDCHMEHGVCVIRP